jgi:predicted AAA+ superfamily ATPase
LYFYDTGLICSILNYIDPIDLLKSEQAGHIFECYAISEIYKSYTNAGLKYKIYYIEDAYSNKEIDFIIEADNNEIYPIEIKKSATYHDKFFSNFNIVNSIKNKKILPMTVICCVENIMKIKDNMYVLPISYL